MKEINTKDARFQDALARAIRKKTFVKKGNAGDGSYLVRGSSGNFYPVQFQTGGGGKHLGSCTCRGAMRGFYCYHLAAALLVHSSYVRQGLTASAPRRSFAPSWSGSDAVRSWV